jgi:hypothetical protein
MRTCFPVVALALLALAGCDDGGGPEPAATPPSAAASQRAGTAPRVEFVDVVQSRLPEVAADRRAEEIEAIATRACASLADGTDAETIVAETRSLGTLDAEAADHATARELVKLAIDTICPDQAARVDEF